MIIRKKERTDLNINQDLRSTFLLRSVEDSRLSEALEILSPYSVSHPRGSLLTHVGEAVTSLTFIASGIASVFRDSEHKVLLNQLTAGACYGAASLFGGEALQPTEIVAKTTVECVSFSESSLKAFFLRFPSSALDYIAFLSGRIRFLNRRVQDFSYGSAEQKTAQLLLATADESGVCGIPNLRAAAESMNIGRASLYRVLSSFSDRGMIEKDGKQIQIIKSNELKGILS